MRLIILLIGVLTTFYTCLGGIEGVIWTDAAQSLVLITGAVTCAVLLPLKMAGGPADGSPAWTPGGGTTTSAMSGP